MIQNIETEIKKIIGTWNVEAVEKNLVIFFLESQKLDVKKSVFIQKFLQGFSPDEKLVSKIEMLHIESIYDLVAAFELLIPTNDKIKNGAFFTPSYIVDFIIDTISPSIDAKNADISCGSGAFVIGLLKYYHNKYNKKIKDALNKNISAFDILPYNITRTKIIISLYALVNNEKINDKDLHIECRDSLLHKWTEKFDNIVGNPPYVRVQDMDDKTKKLLESDSFETTKYGSFNTYFAFFEQGRNLLKPSGQLGYITPNNYFTSLSAECLRVYVKKTKCISKIVDFNASKVFSARTYTAITFMGLEPRDFIEYAKLEDSRVPQVFLKNLSFTPNNYSELNEKKWRLMTGQSNDIINCLENAGDQIGSLFNICAGIATLKDEIYCITPISEDNSFYHIDTKFGPFKIEKKITLPLIKIADMKKQIDVENNNRRIIFPYKQIDKKTVVIDENEMINKYPECLKYLTAAKDVLAGRGKGKVEFNPFYSYGRTQGLNRFDVLLFTPTFSKFPRFLMPYTKPTLFTNGYGFFKKENNTFFQNKITEDQNVDILQKILNSRLMHFYVKKTSVSIEGGYPCYQKNFIEHFSIPSMTQEQIHSLRVAKNESEVYKILKKLYHLKFDLPNLS